MTDRIPDEIMREAVAVIAAFDGSQRDIKTLARALMARDQRAAEIAQERRYSAWSIPGAILSYDEAQP